MLHNESSNRGLLVPSQMNETGKSEPEVVPVHKNDAQNDSDSGLDTTSIGSGKNGNRPDESEKSDESTPPGSPKSTPTQKLGGMKNSGVPQNASAQKSDSGVASSDSSKSENSERIPKKSYDNRRRRIPKLGLSIKTNPDLSYIKTTKSETTRCLSCNSILRQRQPLVKTNGILFMKHREKEVLESENRIGYDSVWDCAFTRSDIVAEWTDDLKDHQDYCVQEIRKCQRMQRRQNEQILESIRKEEENENFDTGQKTAGPNVVSEEKNPTEKIGPTETSEEKLPPFRRSQSKRVSKMDFGEKLKSLKFKVQTTMQRARPQNCGKILAFEEEFIPPTTARPKVKPRPTKNEDFEINFSGKLQSTVLRLHCENCVLKDKPEEFQSVLFVCQL